MELRRATSDGKLPAFTGTTIVVKVGTSSLLRAGRGSLNLSSLARICETVRDFHQDGHRVVVVSSGAIGVGCKRLGLSSRPSGIAQKQALAAIGQVHLMRFYDDFFSALGVPCAQVLLTQDNLGTRSQYLNAKNTFTELFAYHTVPIVNENDTVAVEQVRFGDNDTLAAQVAALVEANWLFLLTDVAALYTSNPNTDPNARPIYDVPDVAALQVDTSMRGTQWGTGGMATKLTAARIATAAGCRMAICLASEPERMAGLLQGQPATGTVFHPHPTPLMGKRRWILSVPVKGALWIDDGALLAVAAKHKSLFAAGIVRVEGDFDTHEAVSICDARGRELGRGLCNYASTEVAKIKGLPSQEFEKLLGYFGSPEIAHRDNICLLALSASAPDLFGSSGSLASGLPAASSPASRTAPLADDAVAPGAAATAAGSQRGLLDSGAPSLRGRGSRSAQPSAADDTAQQAATAASAAQPGAALASAVQPSPTDGAGITLAQASRDIDSIEPTADAVHEAVQQRLQLVQLRQREQLNSRDEDINWQHALTEAMACERQAEQASQLGTGSRASLCKQGAAQDIDEGEWLPK